MAINAVIIILILAVTIFGTRYYLKSLNTGGEGSDRDEDSDDMDIVFFVDETARAFNRTLRQNLSGQNLTRSELRKKREQTGMLREALTNAAFGDSAARRTVKNRIKSILGFPEYQIDDSTINGIVRFNRPEKMTSQERFEVLLYLYKRKFPDSALTTMIRDFDLDKPIKKGMNEEVTITEEALLEAYKGVMSGKSSLGRTRLSFNDKLEILSQLIFERYVGLGSIDTLLDTEIDEVDAGVSGLPYGGFSIERVTKEKISFSYDAIWIVLHGVNIHMKCMGFGSQEELIRVCQNVYQFEADSVLSRTKPAVVSTMKDGSRIVVVRPPFAESYGFFMRRFETSKAMTVDTLIKAKNKAIPMAMMFWIIRGQLNMGITGSQGTGKTTFLKALITYIPEEFNLRLQELSFELNLRFTYPERNIESFQETDSMSAQEGLNLQKKTNGAVNIIGEVANAVQASHIIQTAKVASLFAMFTHHAKTAQDFVDAIANNLLEMSLYADKKDATAEAAKVLNVDCHLTNVKGYRHIERITEIIPVMEQEYPSVRMEDASDQEKFMADAMTFFQRMTNPVLFETKDLIRWEPFMETDDEEEKKDGIFRLVRNPSDDMMDDICSKLTFEEEERFKYDLEMMRRVSDGEVSAEVDEWTKQVLSY